MSEQSPDSGAAAHDAAADDEGLPEQMRVRREKRSALFEKGIDPYPVTVEKTHSIADLRTA